MGLPSVLRRLRIRVRRTWRAWRGGTPRLRTWDDLNSDEKADIKRQMRLTWEEMNEETREALLDDVQRQTEAEVDGLNESFRGGNGDKE